MMTVQLTADSPDFPSGIGIRCGSSAISRVFPHVADLGEISSEPLSAFKEKLNILGEKNGN